MGALLSKSRDQECGPLEIEIEVAVRSRDDAGDAGHGPEDIRQFLRNCARGLAERARELKRDRHCEIAERARRRDLDGKGRHLGDVEARADRGGDRIVDVALNTQNHGRIVAGRR